MASGTQPPSASLGNFLSSKLEQPEHSKAAWPSDLLNFNDAEMAKLFDPNCDHLKYHEDLQEVVSSSVASLPLNNNESLESLIQDLDELSQPVFDPLVNSVGENMMKDTFLNYPDSTARFLCNEDCIRSSIQTMPTLEYSYQSGNHGGNGEALALMPISSEIQEDKGETLMHTVDSCSGIEASTPDDPLFILKESANHELLSTDGKGDASALVHTSDFCYGLGRDVVSSNLHSSVSEAYKPRLDFEYVPASENQESFPMKVVTAVPNFEYFPASEKIAPPSNDMKIVTSNFEYYPGPETYEPPPSTIEVAVPDSVSLINVKDEDTNAPLEMIEVPATKLPVVIAAISNAKRIKSEVFCEESTESAAEKVMETLLNEVEICTKPSPLYISECASKSEVQSHAQASLDSGADMSGQQSNQSQLKGVQEIIAVGLKPLGLSTGAQKIYSCDKCNLKFVKITNLYRHFSAHSKNSVLCCDDCDLTFISGAELQSHNIAVHNCSNELSCVLCQTKVATYPELVEHVGTHTDKKPFQCSECSLLFWKYPEFCRHCQEHTQEELFECLNCSFCFRHESDLHDHKHFVHSTKVESESSSDLNLTSKTCGDTLNELQSLTKHTMEVHGAESECETCGKSYPEGLSMKMHIIRAHKAPLKKKPKQALKSNFECGICQKTFSTVSVYSRHVSTHKPRTRLSSLNAKFRIKVSSLSFLEKEFICEICCATFFRAVELRRHLDSHYCGDHKRCLRKNL